jgi:superfamily II DNA or RNA helicase
MDLLPHQLEPALAVVRGLGSRVLLADAVGLGKTVQAGLIIAELRAHGAADRVLVVTPAGLRDQWAHELLTRFGIEAQVLDARALRRAAAALPVGVNQWGCAPAAIVSVDFIKRSEVLAPARMPRWDVLVVDEAHGVAGESDRHAAVATIAARASYVVLLTATPHSGDRRAFASLCDIGAKGREDLLVFRRSRQDVPLGSARRIHRLHVRMTRAEDRMHALLARFGRETRPRHGAQPGRDYWLALSVLHKRALSSALSLKRSVDRRLAALDPTGGQPTGQLCLPLSDPSGELTAADESPAWSPLLGLDDAGRERHLLRCLAGMADRAARLESKIRALARLLRRVKEPAIVFTEYRDTLTHLQASLAVPSVLLHGGMARDERLASLERFARGDTRLLLATDAAGEGLNLQETCRLVINLELPWNPMRLEQRIGRVDRIGQQRTVHVVHLVARDSAEDTVLSRLQRRVAAARADVGGADPLGTDDEVTVARLIAGDDSLDATLEERSGVEDRLRLLRTPSLNDDARREASRVANARRLTVAGDERALARAEGLGAFIATASHWRTRAALAGRTMMVWQIVAADGSGRHIGSTVVSLLVDDRSRHSDHQVTRCVDRAADAWRQRVAAIYRAFLAVRLAREQEASAGLGLPPPSQTGLFDRREAHRHLASVEAREAAVRDRIERVAAIERAGSFEFLPPRLLLVLTP